MSKTILIRVTVDNDYDDVCDELLFSDFIENPKAFSDVALVNSSVLSAEERKLIERTCKRDAYQAIYCWGLSDSIDKKTMLWYAKEKMDSHSYWLTNQPMQYSCATGFTENTSKDLKNEM